MQVRKSACLGGPPCVVSTSTRIRRKILFDTRDHSGDIHKCNALVPIPWNPNVSFAEGLVVYCTIFCCSVTAVISQRAWQITDIGRDCGGQNDADGKTTLGLS